MQEITAKFKKAAQMIKQAVTTLLVDETGPYPKGQANYNGKTTEYALIIPYGLISSPPVGSHVVLLSSQGQEAVKFGLVSDFENKDDNNIGGETGLRNAITEAFIKLNSNSGIDIDAIAGTVTINSTVIELGSLTTQTLANALFMTAVYNIHTHPESLGGTTGVPNHQNHPGTG
jgi:phage gp45-like